MRPSPRFLNHVFAASVCAAALLPTLAVAASYQHRVNLQGLVVSGPGQAIDGLSVALAGSLLPDAIVGVPYSANLNQLLSVTGDAAYSGAGVTWGVVSSSLPAGLYLTADGFIGGTPTATGAGNVQVRASYKTAKGEQTYQVIAIPLMVTLSSATLPGATVGSPYSYDFKSLVSSNDQAFTGAKASFSATGLPAGLSLDSAGVLSGAPTVKNEAGASFQVVASYKGIDGLQAYTIVVNGVPLQVKQISAGGGRTCAVTIAGGLKCWGGGYLGNNASSSATPVDVTGLTSGVASVSVGQVDVCAVTTAGGLKCWGANQYGAVGDGSLSARLTPVDVRDMTTGVASVAVGYQHTCAVTTAGAAKCWGYNNYGGLGNNSTSNTSRPVQVSGLTSGVVSVATGQNHTCAVLETGAVKCWGYNGNYQLGNGTATDRWTPVTVSGLTSGVASVSSGPLHNCAVTTSGGLKCWGNNNSGNMGDGTTTSRQVPGDVPGVTSGVTQVSVGNGYTCAVTLQGEAKCWGDNTYGQLGDGSTTQKMTPVAVSGLSSGVSFISGGYSHACALTSSGQVKCWGAGLLGNASATGSLVPVDVEP